MKKTLQNISSVLALLLVLGAVVEASEKTEKTLTKNYSPSPSVALSTFKTPVVRNFNLFKLTKSKITSMQVIVRKKTKSSRISIYLDKLKVASTTEDSFDIDVAEYHDYFVDDFFKVTVVPDSVANIEYIGLRITYVEEFPYLEELVQTPLEAMNYIHPAPNNFIGDKYEVGVKFAGLTVVDSDFKFIHCSFNKSTHFLSSNGNRNEFTTMVDARHFMAVNDMYCGYKTSVDRGSVAKSFHFKSFTLKPKAVVDEPELQDEEPEIIADTDAEEAIEPEKIDPIPIVPNYLTMLNANDLASYVIENKLSNLQDFEWWNLNRNKHAAYNIIEAYNRNKLKSETEDVSIVNVRRVMVEKKDNLVIISTNYSLSDTRSLNSGDGKSLVFDLKNGGEGKLHNYFKNFVTSIDSGENQILFMGSALADLSLSLTPIVGIVTDVRDFGLQGYHLFSSNGQFSGVVFVLASAGLITDVVSAATVITPPVSAAAITVDNAIDIVKHSYKKVLKLKSSISKHSFASITTNIARLFRNFDLVGIARLNSDLDYKLAMLANCK
jgi:hypothetical protein